MIPDPKHYCWECVHLTVGRFPIRECGRGHYVTGDFRRQDETPEWGKSVEGGTTMYGCGDLTVREQPPNGADIPKVQCPGCGHWRRLLPRSVAARYGIKPEYVVDTPCPLCTGGA
jgi:hypothetical protein